MYWISRLLLLICCFLRGSGYSNIRADDVQSSYLRSLEEQSTTNNSANGANDSTISTNVRNSTINSTEVVYKENLRFNRTYIAEKEKDLTLLISITSGPGHHLRDAAR